MKRLAVFAVILAGMLSSPALAEWSDYFIRYKKEYGAAIAVSQADFARMQAATTPAERCRHLALTLEHSRAAVVALAMMRSPADSSGNQAYVDWVERQSQKLDALRTRLIHEEVATCKKG